MTSLEWLFRGDLNGSHHSFELDLSLCIWPPHSTVQRIVVPLRMLAEGRILCLLSTDATRVLPYDLFCDNSLVGIK